MILPSGRDDLLSQFLTGREAYFLGCLSFEERSISAPLKCFEIESQIQVSMVRVDDPVDSFPYYGGEIAKKCEEHRGKLLNGGLTIDEIPCDLLATEDQLLDVVYRVRNKMGQSTSVILDITSMPKRFFVFLLKRLIGATWCENLLVSYVSAGNPGYTKDHLATDALPCDHLPGMAGKVPLGRGTLVVSLGFEELNIRSIMQEYHGQDDTRFVMSFPVPPDIERRQWAMLRQLLPAGHLINLSQNVQPIAAWDAESVYATLSSWKHEHPDLVIAPFGIKTHTLGMALFAIEHNCGMYYTQPKSYNPAYTKGIGKLHNYIAKWQGIPAFKRRFVYP